MQVEYRADLSTYQTVMGRSIEILEAYLREHPDEQDGDKRRLREVAYKRLYDALRNVDLESGDPLPEIRLSKALGISRTPVREALQQLATDGLIQIIQGRAVTISARSVQEVFDALHVRELLEPEALRLCAMGISESAVERLQQLTTTMEETARSADRAAWSRADREWHELISDACPNKLLGELVLLARNRMYHKGSYEHVTEQYLIEGTNEHRQVVDAIIARDGDKAEQLMVEHLCQLKENILKRFVH